MKRVQRLAAKAGMSDDDVKRLTAHGLRSGGATDFSLSKDEHITLAWIAKQGGWSKEVLLCYIRPNSHHRWREARRMARAYVSMTATNDSVDNRNWRQHLGGGAAE